MIKAADIYNATHDGLDIILGSSDISRDTAVV